LDRLVRWRVPIVTLVALLFAAAPASAQQPPGPDGQGTDLFVTIAARQCPSYTDITANRARNNIQESLRDLGVDTPYGTGEPVSLAVEETAQPNCTPITGWQFTLGTAIAGNKVVGPWGSLSVVSGAYTTDITTLASVPERDARGRPIALRTVQGATTIELTQGQADRAGASGTQLWIQGGIPTDPVLAGSNPPEYAFGALRCAIDNVNGDNVEYIKYPTGSRHVYCFAYYVVPPPTSGTIVIRKEVSSPADADKSFTFEGNISYTTDNRFPLTVTDGKPASATFYRAAGAAPWNVREIVPDGWQLTGITCTATNSTVTRDLANAAVSIVLAAGDKVTCTYTDRLIPPIGQLLITKTTHGGTGTFPFTVSTEGGDRVRETSATTTEADVPVVTDSGPIDLDPGTYLVDEDLPPRTRAGRWRRTSANCNAHLLGATSDPVRINISAGGGAVCVFGNTFVPAGALAIAKTTRGAGATTGFVISREGEARQWIQTARTSGPGDTAIARGDRTRRLRLGTYVIQETEPVTDERGRWSLLSINCSGRLRGFEQGRVTVQLTRERPRMRCHFVNGFTPDVPPVPGPGPSPSPPPPDATPDLVVTKRALQRRVDFGRVATFEITVRNAGDATAEQVVVGDAPGDNAQLVSARPSQGGCGERLPLICRVGAIAPGEEVTVRVRVRAVGTPTIDNLAVAGTASDEDRLVNNGDRARVRVRSVGGVLGGSCVRPASAVARMAC
jgi:uncharacterized repeat protein (TIGR01451 family)